MKYFNKPPVGIIKLHLAAKEWLKVLCVLGFLLSYYYSILMIELCQYIFKINFYKSNVIKFPVLVSTTFTSNLITHYKTLCIAF
ncbi:unnamed protein product [Klebsiella pneumoniae]|nr:unnamed protein product [Klebsiella pneumoniae]